MAEFYDHDSGKLYFRAPAGGGNSVWDAPATDADIAANPAAHNEYFLGKRYAAKAEEVAKGEADRMADLAFQIEVAREVHEAFDKLKAENAALHARIAEFVKAAEAPLPPSDKPAETQPGDKPPAQ